MCLDSVAGRRDGPGQSNRPGGDVAGNGPFPATATVRPMGSRFYGPRAIPALDALRSNLPANSDLLIQAQVTQSASESNSTTINGRFHGPFAMRGGLRALPRTLTMASTINEIADQCVYRVALGPLWAGVRRTRRRFASHLCPGPVEAGLARQT
jgi:hypothetical protein